MADSPNSAVSSSPSGADPTESDLQERRGDGWGDLFRPPYLTAVLILAGGVALYAMNLYFTAALMPSIVEDIGGADYYAWVATGFLMAAVIASMLVSRFLGTMGAARAYVTGFAVFALGAALNAVSPTMEMLIVGRVVQGFGGGLVAGLGYAVIRSALPDRLWTRAAGLISAMWGAGTLVGPALGGLFAELGAWRWAYGLLLVAALVLAALSPKALPREKPAAGQIAPIPWSSLVLLTLAATSFSVSSTLPRGYATVASLVVGATLIALFVVMERRGRTATVLPRLTYRRGNNLKWVYLTVAAVCAGVMTETFIPLFGQELGGLGPLTAGLFGAALSVGWVVAQLFSVGLATERARNLAIRLGPVILTAGLVAYGALQVDSASVALVILFTVLLFIAGTGIGLAFPHLSVAALRSTQDEQEGSKAAAALNTTQLIANSVASAIAGTLVSLGGSSLLDSARYMVLGVAVITAVGVVTAAFTTRGSRG
ncbi:MFS transporter [Streptomyces sp. NPDC055078]